MVYIYRKIIHDEPYYYLRASTRVNGKIVVKDIAYLGSSLSDVEANLAKLLQYKKEIRKAYKTIKKVLETEHYVNKAKELKIKETPYFDKELLYQIEAIKLHFHQRFLSLDATTVHEAYKNFLIDFAFNTASLEGNTITLAETQRLLRENLSPKNKTLREIYDIQNTEKIFFEILHSKHKIDHTFIISIHDKLLENIDVRKGYRTHDIRVFGKRFEATPFSYIRTDMDILLKWLEKNEDSLHPLALAGMFHHKFEKIHPFSDGNGRTGRMLMNYILFQKEYPFFIVRKAKRSDYLNALTHADHADLTKIDSKYYRRLTIFLAEEMVWSYWNNFLV